MDLRKVRQEEVDKWKQVYKSKVEELGHVQ